MQLQAGLLAVASTSGEIDYIIEYCLDKTLLSGAIRLPAQVPALDAAKIAEQSLRTLMSQSLVHISSLIGLDFKLH
jgi:hypothetical protein